MSEKRVLMLASVASMMAQFNMENVRILREMGYEVDVACNFVKGSPCSDERIEEYKKEMDDAGIPYHQIDFERAITNIPGHFRAYRQVADILKSGDYAFLHCHSPIGGVIGRIAGKLHRVPVIYTAHGFHFFKGGPISSWLLFYPIEKFLSRWTDVLMTINSEDYDLARRKFHMKKLVRLPGVGIDTEKYATHAQDPQGRQAMRAQWGLGDEDIALISVGEVNLRKNHQVIVKAMGILRDPRLHYYIVGVGPETDNLKQLAADLGLADKVHLLGYQSHVEQLHRGADIFCFPSLREGLGLAAIEGMASGLPLVSSNINGIREYSIDGETGYACPGEDAESYAEAIRKLCAEDRTKYQEPNRQRAKQYDIRNVMDITRRVYEQML